MNFEQYWEEKGHLGGNPEEVAKLAWDAAMEAAKPEAPKDPRQTRGIFELSVHEDGQHAYLQLKTHGSPSEVIREWFNFAYCNHLVWSIASMRCDGSDTFWAMVKRDTYTPLFRHIHGEQYLVPGSE